MNRDEFPPFDARCPPPPHEPRLFGMVGPYWSHPVAPSEYNHWRCVHELRS